MAYLGIKHSLVGIGRGPIGTHLCARMLVQHAEAVGPEDDRVPVHSDDAPEPTAHSSPVDCAHHRCTFCIDDGHGTGQCV